MRNTGEATATSRVVRRLAQVAAAGAVAAGAVLVAATPAAAFPGNCSSGYGGLHTTGYVNCTSGSGQYRARVTCDNENPFDSDYNRYGQWMWVGQGSSIAACSNGDYAYNLFLQLIG